MYYTYTTLYYEPIQYHSLHLIESLSLTHLNSVGRRGRMALSGRVKKMEESCRTATHPAQGQGQPGDETPGPTPHLLPLIGTVPAQPAAPGRHQDQNQNCQATSDGRPLMNLVPSWSGRRRWQLIDYNDRGSRSGHLPQHFGGLLQTCDQLLLAIIQDGSGHLCNSSPCDGLQVTS